jgi:hypothetical protein
VIDKIQAQLVLLTFYKDTNTNILPSEIVQLYWNRLSPFKYSEEGKRILLKKQSGRNAYTWCDAREVDTMDNSDLAFSNHRSYGLIKLEEFGFHEYCYVGFFKPDLYEVIHLLSGHISVKELEDIDRIYVTTQYDVDRYPNCLHNILDKHTGKSTFFILKK